MAMQRAMQEQMVLRLNHGHDATEASDLEYSLPKKVACGAAHTLLLKHEDLVIGEEDEPVQLTRVYGWGSNRHNVLGLGWASSRLEMDEAEGKHAKMAKMKWSAKPWQKSISYPSKEVYHKQDPLALPDQTREEHISQMDYREFFEVSAGSNHSMLLERIDGEGHQITDSRLWSCGLVQHGRLGQGRPKKHDTEEDLRSDDSDAESEVGGPGEVVVPPPPDMSPSIRGCVQRVCCGADHTLAIVSFMGSTGTTTVLQARVFAWGIGGFGALGTRSKRDTWVPEEVWFPEDSYDSKERAVTVRQVACGTKHSLALSHDGKVYTWGHAGNGRLGLGRTETRQGASFSAEFAPRRVYERFKDTEIIYACCGESHTGAVDQLGGLHTWGQGSFGRCGHGMDIDSLFPDRVETLIGVAVHQIAFGLIHSIARTVKGDLYAWGTGPATGLDTGNHEVIPVPRHVPLPDRQGARVAEIATGPMHTLVLMHNGAIYCFGAGSDYRMPQWSKANPAAELKDQAFPKKIDDFKGWAHHLGEEEGGDERTLQRGHHLAPKSVHCGGSNSGVLLNSDEVWLWGGADLVQCVEAGGQDRDDDAKEGSPQKDGSCWYPALLRKGLRQLKVRMLAMGYQHAIALSSEGTIFAWGQGGMGQLGTGNLEAVPTPTQLMSPVGVIWVSAGEEHSGCIIEGGEAYTWGMASGGRLGLSSTMSEGRQMLPMQVVIGASEDPNLRGQTRDLRLQSIHCGSQHTAFISTTETLLTCGMGWFGRLGSGSQENSYEPRAITRADLRIREVSCASYHTCALDHEQVLWVAGRDFCCCRNSGDHAINFERFAAFDTQPRRYTVAVAASASHTLAVTSLKRGVAHGTELWVWGKNNKGQLGLNEKESPNIDMPWRLHLDMPRTHRLTQVATTTWHSMALVESKEPGALNFSLYSWGFNGSGRLGHKTSEYSDEIVLQGTSNHIVMPPAKVDIRWRPVKYELMALRSANAKDDTAGSNKGRSYADLLRIPTQDWYQLQQLLHAEEFDCKRKSLENKREAMAITFREYMTDITKLWDKAPPDSGKKTEYDLRRLEMEIESQYMRTLSALDLTKSSHAPRIEDIVKTEPEVSNKLHLFEELLWVLQQQPLYLSNFAGHITGKKDGHEPQLFNRVVGQLFHDFRTSRIRNQLKALLRYMIIRELQRARNVQELFDPWRSRVAGLFAHMCTDIHFMESVMLPILAPDDPHSLMYTIIRYTLTKDAKTARGNEQPDKVEDENKKNPYVTGVFATNQAEFEEMDERARDSRGLEKRQESMKAKGRQYFQDESKDIKKLICGTPGTQVLPSVDFNEYTMKDEELKERFKGVALLDEHGWAFMRHLYAQRGHRDPRQEEQFRKNEEELRRRVMSVVHGWDEKTPIPGLTLDVPPMKDFVRRFVKNILKSEGCEDFQMLLTHTFEYMTQQDYVVAYKSTTGDGWQPDLMQPLVSLVLSSMLSNVLIACIRRPEFAILRLKIKECVLKMEAELLGLSSQDLIDGRDPSLEDRVWWNVEKIGLFFERVVHKRVYEWQIDESPPSASKVEAKEAQDAARELMDDTCAWLMQVMYKGVESDFVADTVCDVEDAGGKIRRVKIKAVNPDGTFKFDIPGEYWKSVSRERLRRVQDAQSAYYHRDETETQLTVDLYTSHYSLEQDIVTMSTPDLLELTNMLFKFMDGDSSPNYDQNPIVIDEKDDALQRLVMEILPTKTVEFSKTPRKVPWDSGHLAIAKNSKETHSFHMRSRFLEFSSQGPDAPTFCEVTHAPVPRYLCLPSQKSRTGKPRAVRPLREDRGKDYDLPGVGKVYPCEELHMLLEELSGSAAKGDENFSPTVKHKIEKSSFQDLKQAFEDVQRRISAEMHDGHQGTLSDMLQRLERGKVYISKIKESMEEKELRSYIERELKRRYEFNIYLESLKTGALKIREAQDQYRSQLQARWDRLNVINKATTACDVPEDILIQAQLHSIPLKFADTKRIKTTKRRKDPTPAQKVLDELLKAQGETGGQRDLETLKDMVGFPSRTFSTRELEQKGVLVRLNENIPAQVQKSLTFTFQYENEGYTVRVARNKTLLREFFISRRDLAQMNMGRKSAIVSYGDDFVWVHCFRLRRLLAMIMAEGGL